MDTYDKFLTNIIALLGININLDYTTASAEYKQLFLLHMPDYSTREYFFARNLQQYLPTKMEHFSLGVNFIAPYQTKYHI